jgi:hypothetical protein
MWQWRTWATHVLQGAGTLAGQELFLSSSFQHALYTVLVQATWWNFWFSEVNSCSQYSTSSTTALITGYTDANMRGWLIILERRSLRISLSCWCRCQRARSRMVILGKEIATCVATCWMLIRGVGIIVSLLFSNLLQQSDYAVISSELAPVGENRSA